jgi:hypothetical protein
MTDATYLMAFTSGALLHHASVTLAQHYAELADWDAVKARVLADNLLQVRTESAGRRMFREVASRLRELTRAELDLLLEGSRPDQQHVLWLAVCKRYRFIHDFAVDVVRAKFLRLDLALTLDDYDVFFSDKAEWHPEVAGVAESTRKKQRQVVFAMLREAGLLSDEGHILHAMPAARTVDAIVADDPVWRNIYPLFPAEIQEWLP